MPFNRTLSPQGDGNLATHWSSRRWILMLSSTEPFPRKGTETPETLEQQKNLLPFNRTLSPQGDGNVNVLKFGDQDLIRFNRTLSPQGDGN